MPSFLSEYVESKLKPGTKWPRFKSEGYAGYPDEFMYERETTPELEAESVYGKGKLGGILERKAGEYIKRNRRIPWGVRTEIPSYDIRHWREASPIYGSENLNTSVGGFVKKPTSVGLGSSPGIDPSIYVYRLGRDEKDVQGTIEHELTHKSAPDLVPPELSSATWNWDRPDKEFLGTVERSSPVRSLREKAEMSYNSLLGGTEPSPNPSSSPFSTPDYPREYDDEIVSNMVPVVRHFYRKEGRTIESPADVQKALDYYEQEFPAYEGKTESLRSIPYINELGMLLVKNNQIRGKSVSIGSASAIKFGGVG